MDNQRAVRNFAHNSTFNYATRHSVTTWSDVGDGYLADRWFRFKQGGGGTAVWTQLAASGMPGNGGNSMRFGRTNGSSNTAQTEVMQALESGDSVELQGKQVVLSFWARKGSGFSGANLSCYIGTGTGIDEGVVATWTGQASVGQKNIPAASLSTSVWQRYYTTAFIPANVTQLRFDFNYIPTGTAGATDYVEISRVMFHEGYGPVPYVRAGLTFAGEENILQRYAEICNGGASGIAEGTTQVAMTGKFATRKRIAPGIIRRGTANAVVRHAGTDFTATSVTFANAGGHTTGWWGHVQGFTGLTSGGTAQDRGTSEYVVAVADL